MSTEQFFTRYAYEEFEGLPPSGEAGPFVGYAADRTPFILRWAESEWQAIGFSENRPFAFWGDAVTKRIVRYAWLPAPISDDPATRAALAEADNNG